MDGSCDANFLVGLHKYIITATLYCEPNNNRPSGVSGLDRGQDSLLSFAPPLQTLSGLCQSDEQSLNSSTTPGRLKENIAEEDEKESETGMNTS
ncbi:hypothetical protein NQZ68_008523 [Dissostichus eleginoides]|nr:hypothetical protein NQZ68_008523 [Dissostichus eleginoides]